MYKNYEDNIKDALKKLSTKEEIVDEVIKAKKELDICYDNNVIGEHRKYKAVKNCYFILDKIIKESI